MCLLLIFKLFALSCNSGTNFWKLKDTKDKKLTKIILTFWTQTENFNGPEIRNFEFKTQNSEFKLEIACFNSTYVNLCSNSKFKVQNQIFVV